MVGIRVVESENWRKEEEATKCQMLGKNFLAKSNQFREIPGFGPGSRVKSVRQQNWKRAKG
jgi:hypothetical protein